MELVTVHEASAHLAELLAAALKGEKVMIVGEDHQPVMLVPTTLLGRELGAAADDIIVTDDATATLPARRPQFGSAAGQIWMAEDFDAPLEDFAEYM